jgi:hypothetical protein
MIFTKKNLSLFICLLISTVTFSQSNSGLGIQYIPKPDMTEYYNLELESLQQRIAFKAKMEEILKNRAIDRMNETKRFYNSNSNYPKVIPNGWHQVVSMNNRDKCEDVKVFVEDNKLKKYYIEDWKQIIIAYSAPISQGKAIVQLKNENGSKGDMVDIYFLENISNPYSKSTQPQTPGKVNFYTTHKRSGKIEIYLDGEFEGTLEQYFDVKSNPSCGQNGTLTIERKPGSYNYTAIGSSGKWSGVIEIKANACSSFALRK